MASLAPILVSQGVGLAMNAIGAGTNQDDFAAKQLRARQQVQEQQLAADAALQKQRIETEAKNAEDRRKKALRRAVARQRVNFAGSGISADSGSSQAVLLGMFEESEDEKRQRTSLDNLRNNAIDQNLASRRSLNVLQRTQLEEKRRLGQASQLQNALTRSLNGG